MRRAAAFILAAILGLIAVMASLSFALAQLARFQPES